MECTPHPSVLLAPAEKAKDEYDVINMAETKCKPSGFTKWDRTWVDRGELSLGEFLNVFKEMTGVSVLETKKKFNMVFCRGMFET